MIYLNVILITEISKMSCNSSLKTKLYGLIVHFVLYNAIRIKKLIEEPRIRYKEEDCTYLIRHYEHKNKHHIVGEYAKLLATNKEKGNEFCMITLI